jgi:hypothetical protein
MDYVEAWEYLHDEMRLYFTGDRNYDKDMEAIEAVNGAIYRLKGLEK